jgi:DNA-binding transcriptional MerR regulator
VRIGELASRSGVSVRALRYYEEQRLLESDRSLGGQRHYPESAVARVQLIQLLYGAGLSSRTIADLPERASPATLQLLNAKRDRLDRQLGALRHSVDTLDNLLASVRAKVS